MRSEVRAWWEQAIADLDTAEANLKEQRYEEPPNVLYDKTIASRTLVSAKEVLEWIDKHL